MRIIYALTALHKMICRSLTAIMAVICLSGLPVQGAETLTFDDAATLDGVMALHPGWSYVHDKNGRAALEAGLRGQAFSASFGGGNSIVSLTRALPSPKQVIYVGLSMKASRLDPMLTGMQFMWLTSGGRTDAAMNLSDSRGIILNTNMLASPLAHYPGAYWWPEKWNRYVIGIGKGTTGFLKVWMNGACIYSNSFDTDSALIDGITIGLPNSWDGLYVTGKVLIDNLSIGDTFSQVDTQPARRVGVTPTVKRIVNPDCFGVHLGFYGWGWKTSYPKVISLAREVGFHAGRSFLHGNSDWDDPWPYFMYKPLPTDPPEATVEHHLLAMSSAPDPLMMCVMNIWGEKNASWRPEKSVEQVQFNQLYARPDGITGLRSVYELSNEPSLYTPITEGWYYRAGAGRYDQIGCGTTTYQSVYKADSPEFLDNTNQAYNYRLDFAPEDCLYIGHRWRFESIAYALANASKVTPGNKALKWEYWNGSSWIPFGTMNRSMFINQYPKPASNFAGRSGWCFCRWDDTEMSDWARASMASISGSGLSQEALYYIRIFHDYGAYGSETPVESFVSAATSPSGYLEAMQTYYPYMLDAGAEMYASPGNEGMNRDFLPIMEQNPDLFDGIMWHHYPDPPISTSMTPGSIYAPPSAMLWGVDRIALRADDLRQRFPGKRIGLSEWSSSGTPTQPVVTLAGGLMAAMGICRILQSGWDSAIFHSLFYSFYNPHAVISENVNAPVLRPAGQALKAIRDHAKYYVLGSSSSHAGIFACAFGGPSSRDGSLVIVNRTDTAMSVHLSMPVAWKRRLAIYEMRAGSLSADNETIANVMLRHTKTISAPSSMKLTYSFPAYSMTIFDTKLP